jgi:hypothetical protein
MFRDSNYTLRLTDNNFFAEHAVWINTRAKAESGSGCRSQFDFPLNRLHKIG